MRREEEEQKAEEEEEEEEKDTVSWRLGGIRFWNVEVVLIDEELMWRTGKNPI